MLYVCCGGVGEKENGIPKRRSWNSGLTRLGKIVKSRMKRAGHKVRMRVYGKELRQRNKEETTRVMRVCIKINPIKA